MNEKASVMEYLNEFNEANLQLISIDIKFSEHILTLLVLLGLPKDWNYFMMTLSTSNGKNELKLRDVISAIIREKTHEKQLRAMVCR